MTENDEIFTLYGDNLTKIPSRNMRAGFHGKSLEDALQSLLENYPEVIPGSQIDPSADEPPRFALLRREMPVGSWSLDHLYVDQFGVLTLVETKLIQNPESRRDVIGQIVEYASNAQKAWGNGRARQHAVEFWNKKGQELGNVLQERFPDANFDQLWRDVEENLRLGRIRLLLAADTLRPEVRRMIEYLNQEMQHVEVLGLELRMYGESGDELIFVPRIVGQTQEASDRKSSQSGEKNWTPELLRDAFKNFNPDNHKYMLQILNWSLENECFVNSRAINPSFGLLDKGGNRFISFYLHHPPYLWMEETRYQGGKQARNRLLGVLQDLDFYEDDIDPDEIVSGKNAQRDVWDLSREEFQTFMKIIQEYCVG